MKIKYAVFAALSFLIGLAVFLFLFLTLDLYLHGKFLRYGGLNYRGYRGAVLGRKASDEIRVAMIGGSVVFGYGVRYQESLPARLERSLQDYSDSSGAKKKITVINLAYNNEGAYAFRYNLEDFLYLDYDYVIFYSGYNDLGAGNVTVFRHSNPIFRLFGYMPILPVVIREKIMAMESGGHLESAYLGKKIVFSPDAKEKVTISVLNDVLKTYNGIENSMARFRKIGNVDFDPKSLAADKWAWYKHFMKKAIDFALSHKKKVMVITQPYLSDAHVEQQRELAAMIADDYNGRGDLLYVNMGRAISLKDDTLVFDSMHMTPKGCGVIADIMAAKVRDYVLSTKAGKP